MADNKKISFDVTVNSDAQHEVEKYVQSFNSLRNSINGLSHPFNSFSNELNVLDRNLSKYTDSLKTLQQQNKELASDSDKTYEKVTNASSAFILWNDVVKVFTNVLRGWGMALSGGLAIVTTFLPEIINFAKALFTGKDALNAMVINFKNLNEVTKAANKDAAEEITKLQILYKSATDVNSSYEDRLKSIKELKKEFPSHFKSVSDETILNGKAKKNYDELTASILENAKAKAALSKISELVNKSLNEDIQIQKIRTAEMAEIKRVKALPQYSRSEEIKLLDENVQQKSINAQKKVIHDRAVNSAAAIRQNQESLRAQIDFITKWAGGAGKIAKIIGGSGTEKGVEFNLGVPTGNTQINNVEISNPKPPKPAPPTPDLSRSLEALEAHAVTFTMQIEQDKKHYDAEMGMLNQQLAKKRISQEEYNAQSVELQDKYHQDISNNIELFNKSKMDEMQGIINKIVAANRKVEGEQRKSTIHDDEKDLNKALLPGAKFDAEKKLIDDKFAYEIFLAEGNNEKKKELAIKHQQDITALSQQYEQQRRDFALNTAQQVADKAFGIIGNNIKASSDAKIKGLEKDKAGELSNKNLTATQRKAIEDKYKKKEAEEKIKAFKAEQRASVVQAVVNGALAITKATAQTGVFAAFVIPGIIASTALQVATIIAQKPPAFAKGGQFVSDGRGALLPGYSRTDNTNAYLRSGEAVVVSEAMRNPWARNLVSAINVAHGGRDFSAPNTGRGYAIGGIFTDGGNANRYYNQPVNDIKDMANTLAYQMINNFPPIYVDVKDVNNQQNILAQTVNRVNL
nr:hypothetical protein [uncultured Mucilaginibacter sp.]